MNGCEVYIYIYIYIYILKHEQESALLDITQLELLISSSFK